MLPFLVCSERAEDIYRIVAQHLGVPLVEVSTHQQLVTCQAQFSSMPVWFACAATVGAEALE